MRTSDVSIRQRRRLRSANRRQLVVPRHRRSKFGRRSLSVAALMVWNSFEHRQLQICIKDSPVRARRSGTRSVLKALRNALYNSTTTTTTTTIPLPLKVKAKASSLDIAPLTTLNSGALQPRKWQLTGNDCSIYRGARSGSPEPALTDYWAHSCSQQAYYAPVSHARSSPRNPCT